MKLSVSALALVSMCVIACGPPNDPTAEIKTDQVPTGTFEGAAWAMTKATISVDGDRLSVKMFSDPAVADCAFSSTDDSGYLLFSMPTTLGHRRLQLDLLDWEDPANQTVTFVTPPSSNNISVDGILNLTELTETSVTLGLIARAGEGNELNGTVTTTLCP